jgi:hypothetical protein
MLEQEITGLQTSLIGSVLIFRGTLK